MNDAIDKHLARKTRKIKKKLTKLYFKYQKYDSGTISAYIDANTSDDNDYQMLRLKSDLIKAEYSTTLIDCICNNGMVKPSFIVFGGLYKDGFKDHLVLLGEKYNQDYITYFNAKSGKYYLIGTSCNVNAYPKYHDEIELRSSTFSPDGELYQEVPGRPFKFSKLSENKFDFDCTKLSYTFYTNLAMTYFGNHEDFMLPH